MKKNFKQENEPKSTKPPTMGDSLRERMSVVTKDGPDIGDIWAEQRKIDAEDKRLAQEYKQAKLKAKELKSKLRESRKEEDLTVLKDRVKTAPNSLRKSRIVSLVTSYAKIVYSSVARVLNYSVVTFKKLSFRLQIIAGALTILVVVGLAFVYRANTSHTGTLGDSTLSSDAPFVSDELPIEVPSFELLYPVGSTNNSEAVRISPDGNEPAYVYVDKLEGVKINVTQQRLPENLRTNQDKELEELARGFQATNVIQIDESLIYHGYSEKSGIQSLIFVKEDLLIFIRSDRVLSDDIWAGYIISLK